MKKMIWIALIVVFLAAFFASKKPDGLDLVSKELGLSHKALITESIMTDYSIPFLPKGGISTALSGVMGVLVIFGVFGAVALVFRKR